MNTFLDVGNNNLIVAVNNTTRPKKKGHENLNKIKIKIKTKLLIYSIFGTQRVEQTVWSLTTWLCEICLLY